MFDTFSLFTTVNTLNQSQQQPVEEQVHNPFTCTCDACHEKWQAEAHISKSYRRNQVRMQRLRDQIRRDW